MEKNKFTKEKVYIDKFIENYYKAEQKLERIKEHIYNKEIDFDEACERIQEIIEEK